ncbi:MAG: thioredoxin family protein [Phycisphaerae bacterium]|jgi:thiol-disulfide isomerase/thioredoxin|nr:thioredoxin family protein [Phycisphaerae bacterium]
MMSKTSQNCLPLAAIAVAMLVFTASPAPAADKTAPATQPKTKAYPPYPKVIGLSIGDAAPDFKLPGVDGKTHTLAEYKDAKILAVVFTCNHCPTSRMQEDAIIKLSTDYAKKGVKLVAISPNDPGALRPDEVAGTVLGDSFEEMKIRAKEKKYPFPYLYDGDTQKTSMAYGATLTPIMFIFDKDRKLRYTGAVEGPPYSTAGGPHARVAIESMLAGKKIVYDRTRPFGCSTKWGFKRRSVDYATAMWNEKTVGMADIDLAAVKKLAANDTSVLRLICVWSLTDKSSQAAFDDLVMLRRIYQHRPLELITVNVDPPAKKKEALALLKKHHAARPDPSRFSRTDPKAPINYVFTGKDSAALLKALGAKDKSKAKAPYSAMIIPGGEVIHTQTGKLDPKALRAQLVKVFQR